MDETLKNHLTGLDPPVNTLLDEEADLPYGYPGGFKAYLKDSGGFVVIYSPQTLNFDGITRTCMVQMDVLAPSKAEARALADRITRTLHQHPSSSNYNTPYELLTENNTPIDGGYKTTLTFQGPHKETP